MDIMDGILVYRTERTAHTTHNTSLLTISNLIVAHIMTTDAVLVPSESQGSFYRTDITFSRLGIFIIIGITIFS
ncbi:hypothetical protein D3C80_614900 [compost metagenome]